MKKEDLRLIESERIFDDNGKKLCSSLVIILRTEGILGSSNPLEISYALDGVDISIKIEQMGIRTVSLIPATPLPMAHLWDFYGKFEKLLVLLDGRFLIVEKVEFTGADCSETEYVAYASECLKRRLAYCKTDPAYCYSDHCFLPFDIAITTEILDNWLALHEELDIAHQVALYNIADTGVTHDVKCVNYIECLEPLTEIINEYEYFFPSLKPSERTTTLKMCIDAVISKYGADIFSKEYIANKERFLQVLVNTRNRIMHIKRNQPKDKYLSGTESILYLVKLCHLYRVVLLSILGIEYSCYKDAVINSVKRWDSWQGVLDDFISGLK